MAWSCRFTWASGFTARQDAKFRRAQNYIDRQSVVHMAEFCPVAPLQCAGAGKLRDSVRIDSPGHISYNVPYARHQYYDTYHHANRGNPKAQRLWFEVMKGKYSESIHRGAAKRAGAK